MKPSISYFIFITIFCTCVSLNAQDYKVFNENDTILYSTTRYQNQEIFNGLRVDSIKTDSKGLRYFFPQTINWADTSNDWCERLGYFFIGPELQINPQGEQYLKDISGDLIKIYSKDSVGSSWSLKKWNDSIVLVGTRLADSIFSFQNIQDSIWRLRLNLKDTSGLIINDRINGLEVWIGKKHGIVKTINFYDLMYSKKYEKLIFRTIKMSGHSKLGGILPMTYGDLYNFQIGDEFHFRTCVSYNPADQSGSYTNFIVAGKKQKGKSISYRMNVTSLYTYSTGNPDNRRYTSKGVGVDSIIVEDTSQYYFKHLPGNLLDKGRGYFDISNILFNQDDILTAFYNGNSYHTQNSGDSCLSDSQLGSSGYSKWISGIGESYSYSLSGMRCHTKELVYYKKGNKTWGTSLSNQIVDYKQHQEIKIYPNPAQESTIIKTQDLKAIQVFDLAGNKMIEISLEIPLSEYQLQVSNLSAGTYLLKIESKEGVSNKKLQIIN